jgi:hypothetical protein
MLLPLGRKEFENGPAAGLALALLLMSPLFAAK